SDAAVIGTMNHVYQSACTCIATNSDGTTITIMVTPAHQTGLQLTSVSPSSYPASQGSISFTLTGTGFTTTDVQNIYVDHVTINESAVSARTSTDGTTLSFTSGGQTSPTLGTPGTHNFAVRDMTTGQTSNSVNFTITPVTPTACGTFPTGG